MKKPNCIHSIHRVAPLREPPTLVGLWLAWLAGRLRHMPEQLLVWLERSRQRRRLGEMDDRMLRDIGVSRSAAFTEMQKWFWQP
jgi:uncharacterized protein YjiS (DUF1127 family)